MTKARDIADFKFEDIVDTGTEGTKVAAGTTAQRGSTTGQWRYNTTTGFFEGRNATGSFSTLEPAPTITSVDTTEVASDAGGNETFVITGTNFTSGGIVAFVGSTAQFNASTTTIDSTTQVTAVAPKASFLNAQEPYKIKFTSSSGLAGTSATGLINVDNAPSWTTASGSIYTGGALTDVSATVVATDPEGDTISYSETTSVLSTAGLSINSSTGVISGTPNSVSSNTTYTFTIRATAGTKTADREFSLTITPPTIEVFVLGGGGSGGFTNQGWVGGGGGSGGIAYHNNYSISASTDYAVVVGAGGAEATSPSQSGTTNLAPNGSNSSFNSVIIGYGGGGGAGYNGAYTIGASGGSGGGSEGGAHGQSQGASATQGTGGTTHYGERGGIGNNGYSSGAQSGTYLGGGGGGTGEAGDTDGTGHGGDGTSAFDTWLSATSQGVLVNGTRYIGAGGSAGATYGSQTPGGLGGGGQGGNSSGSSGTAGQANTGSGGGGRGFYNSGSGTGGAGGSGLVIVRYAGSQIAGATGGTIVESGGYTYHTFTADGTFRSST